jgi:8-hydroxy-5-deazaflavin:NADPH oxidoreductase
LVTSNGSVAILGGTGPEGTGLAFRLARAGVEVVIGSRSQERAEEAAASVRNMLDGGANVSGQVNREAAATAEVIVNTLPYEAQAETLPDLRDAIAAKLFVSAVVPMTFEKGVGASALPVPQGSAAEQAQELLPEARVTGAFQTLSASNLKNAEHELDADVLVTADDKEARRTIMELVERCKGLRAVDAGRLANTQYVEHITPLLANINRRYKAHTEVKVVGLPDQAQD